jgi:hypothetical protein
LVEAGLTLLLRISTGQPVIVKEGPATRQLTG